MGKKVLSIIIWAAIAFLGAASFALLALSNGETISASWLLIAAVCTYAVAYRFYSKFIAYKIFKLDDNRATPAEINDDGKDYVPTNKWVLFGISNQMLAAMALAVGTTIIIKMGKARYAWVSIIPFLFLTITTLTAAIMKLFSSLPSVGFIAHAKIYQAGIDKGEVLAPATSMDVMKQIVFNDRLDAVLTFIFAAIVILITIESFRIWYNYLVNKNQMILHETPYIKSKYAPIKK